MRFKSICNKVKEYWKKFCEEKNIPEDTKYEAWSFGNTKEMADELGDLVNKGIKTATTGAYELYEEDEEIPKDSFVEISSGNFYGLEYLIAIIK